MRSDSGNDAAGKGYKPCTHRSRISQRWSIEGGSGSGRPVKGYEMTSLQTVPCHIAGMGGSVLLEEKCVSNSPIDWQDIWVKDFIQASYFQTVILETDFYILPSHSLYVLILHHFKFSVVLLPGLL